MDFYSKHYINPSIVKSFTVPLVINIYNFVESQNLRYEMSILKVWNGNPTVIVKSQTL